MAISCNQDWEAWLWDDESIRRMNNNRRSNFLQIVSSAKVKGLYGWETGTGECNK